MAECCYSSNCSCCCWLSYRFWYIIKGGLARLRLTDCGEVHLSTSCTSCISCSPYVPRLTSDHLVWSLPGWRLCIYILQDCQTQENLFVANTFIFWQTVFFLFVQSDCIHNIYSHSLRSDNVWLFPSISMWCEQLTLIGLYGNV